jgi:hypothetical protein
MKLMRDGDSSSGALVSIAISALTTGFAVAVLNYDFDTDPARRSKDPGFYGYIPDDGTTRLKMFVCMTMSSALLLLIRSIAAAYLMSLNKWYFFVYTAVDVGVMLFYKTITNDFWHWIPLSGRLAGIYSLLMRVITKVITDYTGVMQSRNAADLGGIYWTANMLLASMFSIVALSIYQIDTTEEEFNKLGTYRQAWSLMLGLNALYLLFFIAFLRYMKRNYRRTFLSIQTGRERTRRIFLDHETDGERAQIFKRNYFLWRDLHEEVKEWVKVNWWRWQDSSPDWFSPELVSKIPDDMIPIESLMMMQKKGRKVRKGRGFRKGSSSNGSDIMLYGPISLERSTNGSSIDSRAVVVVDGSRSDSLLVVPSSDILGQIVGKRSGSEKYGTEEEKMKGKRKTMGLFKAPVIVPEN